MRAAPGVKGGAAAAFAMGVDQLADRRIEPRLPQRFDDEAALPRPVRRRAPMLNRTATANTEMRADRRDALGVRTLDPQQGAAVGMAGHGIGFDDLARQGAGHIDRPVGTLGNAVAAMADAPNGQPFNHGRPQRRTR